MALRKLDGRLFAAVTFADRLRGMIGRRFGQLPFEVMYFPRCGSIHTWFMGEKIDVIFTDKQSRICRICRQLPPWRWRFGGRGAVNVYELASGNVPEDWQAGDQLEIACTAPGVPEK